MKENTENKNYQVLLLQENLAAIRKIAGWTAEQLAEKIGVTKQTISNLETGKTKMSLAQYIAIRTIIDYEIESNKENTVLPQVVTILVDKADELDEKDYKKLKKVADTVSISAAAGVAGATLAAIFSGLMLTIPTASVILGIVGAIAATPWLHKILNKNKEEQHQNEKEENDA